MTDTWHPVRNIAALRDAIAWPNPTENAATTGSPQLDQLIAEAKATLWDSLPLYAIAEAHKKRGDKIMAQGDPEGNGETIPAVYVAYLKYLLLCPEEFRHGNEYVRVCKDVRLLEDILNPEHELPRRPDPRAASTQNSANWKGVPLGLVAVAAVPFCLKRV
ncbi:hypothetical protein FB451DRAFT_1234692 [Mycena latifolia]|nr:hypothetical protein FB451DRAFT_1234692 [Mycena latifolia]